MIPDDLSIPDFLRRPHTAETKAAIERLVEQDRKHRTAGTRKLRRRHLTDEQATELRIKSEAESRWRSWIPTMESRVRPRRATFERLVREEFKAKVASTMEGSVPKSKKSKKSKKPTPVAAEARAPVGTPGGVRPGSKLEAIVGLLTREGGCTTKDVLDATGWPSVSMPQQAKSAGLVLRKEKIAGVTHYYGQAA